LTRGAIIGQDASSINDQINTQIAIQQGVAASQQGLLASGNLVGLPALSLLSSGNVISARDASALGSQIATQNVINQGSLLNGGLILVQ
jgi:hypothetical protein